MRLLTQEQFIEKSRKVHGEVYDYSKSTYKGSSKPLTIICSAHGEFSQTPSNHHAGKGCKKCGDEELSKARRHTEEDLRNRLSRHIERGLVFPRLSLGYENNTSYLIFICPTHGRQIATAAKLFNSELGCAECSSAALPQRQPKSQGEFIRQAKVVHKDKYDYSHIEYKRSKEKVGIRCIKHDYIFMQGPTQHLKGQGCPRCGASVRNVLRKISEEDLVSSFREVHGETYEDYDVAGYVNYKDKIRIKCRDHGWFTQTPDGHLRGSGCLKCGRTYAALTSYYGSRKQLEVSAMFRDLGFDVKDDAQIFKGSRREVDTWIADKNLAIEYNGAWFHSTKFKSERSYHLNKQVDATKAGIRLIHIFDDEWIYRNEACRNTLKAMVGCSPKLKGGARTTRVISVCPEDAAGFYDDYHIQGHSKSVDISFGLEKGGETLAVMSFSKRVRNRGNQEQEGVFELTRFATSISIAGAASRLFTHMVNNLKAITVITYSDNRWFKGGVYELLDFIKSHVTGPNYTYTKNGAKHRLNKASFQKKALKRKYPEIYQEGMTEEAVCEAVGLYRVYDCGLTKWLWTQQS